MIATTRCPSLSDLDAYRHSQRLAYRCAESIAAELKPGMTERRTAALMKSWLLDHGVREWFHQPFAWFGDRTALENYSDLGKLHWVEQQKPLLEHVMETTYSP